MLPATSRPPLSKQHSNNMKGENLIICIYIFFDGRLI